MLKCTLCGKELPNRYAIAGTCEKPGCEEVFCTLHWREGNRRCRAHGWKPKSDGGNKSSPISKRSNSVQSMSEEVIDSKKVSPERKKQAMKETLRLIGTLGKGIADKLRNLVKAKTPQEMIDELESQHEANRTRREGSSQKLESLYSRIAKKKKQYATAPKARQRVLKMELKGLLSDYKAQERTLGILLENERAIGVVRSRLEEVLAYGLSDVNEDLIDDVTDRLDEAADEAEGRLDALSDLERAGRRRERESERESLWDELDGFGEEDTSSEPEEAEIKKVDLSDDLGEFEEPEKES